MNSIVIIIINNNLLLSQSVHSVVGDGDDDITLGINDNVIITATLDVVVRVGIEDSPVKDRLVSFTAYSVVYGTLL